MPFEIVRNDIVNMHVDAIVNTANPNPVIGSGTDAAIHAKAGPRLLLARKLIGSIRPGQVHITPGFGLPAKYVIHTVGPVWQDGESHEADTLRSCYRNALHLARRLRLRSVAFPLISTGNYGFPKKLALQIAVETIAAFLLDHEMQIYLVVFSKDSYAISETLFSHVKNFIDERYVQEKTKAEYDLFPSRQRLTNNLSQRNDSCFSFPEPDIPSKSCGYGASVYDVCEPDADYSMDYSLHPSESSAPAPAKDSTGHSPHTPPHRAAPRPRKQAVQKAAKPIFSTAELNRRLNQVELGFSDTLLKLIDQSGRKDSEIYKKANIDRKLFSKIRTNPHYKPSKPTAIAFAIALELDLEQTKDLIARAGYALSGSSKFDIIIEYFITHGRYDIYEINTALFEFDQSLLGA